MGEEVKIIKVPSVIWVLGDREQSTASGVTIVTRPLYYQKGGIGPAVRVGTINPDYAEPLMDALSKAKK